MSIILFEALKFCLQSFSTFLNEIQWYIAHSSLRRWSSSMRYSEKWKYVLPVNGLTRRRSAIAQFTSQGLYQ